MLCPISGMNWSNGSNAGAWTANYWGYFLLYGPLVLLFASWLISS